MRNAHQANIWKNVRAYFIKSIPNFCALIQHVLFTVFSSRSEQTTKEKEDLLLADQTLERQPRYVGQSSEGGAGERSMFFFTLDFRGRRHFYFVKSSRHFNLTFSLRRAMTSRKWSRSKRKREVHLLTHATSAL